MNYIIKCDWLRCSACSRRGNASSREMLVTTAGLMTIYGPKTVSFEKKGRSISDPCPCDMALFTSTIPLHYVAKVESKAKKSEFIYGGPKTFKCLLKLRRQKTKFILSSTGYFEKPNGKSFSYLRALFVRYIGRILICIGRFAHPFFSNQCWCLNEQYDYRGVGKG